MDTQVAKAEYAEAKRLHAAGRHADALVRLDALDAAFPDSKNILLARAECLFALGNREKARADCERVLATRDDTRARRILAACSAVPSATSDSEPAPVPIDVPEAIPQAFKPVPAARERHRYIYTLPFLLFAGVVAIFVAKDVMRRTDPLAESAEEPSRKAVVQARTLVADSTKPEASVEDPDFEGEVAPAYTKEEIEKFKEDLKQQRVETYRREVAEFTEARREASKKPGYVIPKEEWNLDPQTGVPAWRPGIYRQLPCPGSWFEEWNAPRTLDLYIPMAYAARPEELFPTLSITMPGINPGFLGLEPWAERRSVILIVINTSTNRHHPGGNTEAQIAAMNFLYGHIRAHPTLNFAAGTSGGARMALRAAARWPDAFAGVLLMAHSGDDLTLSPHLRMGIIHGRDDFNAVPISHHVQRLRAAGFDLRYKVIPGGHITAPPAEEAQMLDWMLDAARRDLEAAKAAERPEI